MRIVLGNFRGKPVARAAIWMSITVGMAAAAFSHSAVHAADHVGGPGSEMGISPVQDPDVVRAFWTEKRMEDALRGKGPPGGAPTEPPLLEGADMSGYVQMPRPYVEHAISRINGILFYVEPSKEGDGQVAHCSASVLRSRSQSLVLTATHCVHRSNAGVWHEMVMFVPAYNGAVDAPLEERAPLGKWPIRQAFIPYDGADGSFDDDVAVLSVYPKETQDGAEETLEQVVGDAFEPLLTQSDIFNSLDLYGYPGANLGNDDNYHGEQRHCRSPAVPYEQTMALTLPHCTAQDGNSGGPIVLEEFQHVMYAVGVVHDTKAFSRLLPSTFTPIYQAADESVGP